MFVLQSYLFYPMKKLCFIIIVLITNAQSFAQVKHAVTKSAVTYEIKNMGINTSGKFKTLETNITFDPNNLAASNIEAAIDVNSIDSDNAMRDNHLKAEDYFDTAKYPKINMKSTAFKKKAGNNYVGIFNVTIKGKTKPVEVPFTYTESSNVALFKGSFKINRKEFGVGGNSMVLADDATINLVVETSK
jgi:polyisoprenoid-binding protein YceI